MILIILEVCIVTVYKQLFAVYLLTVHTYVYSGLFQRLTNIFRVWYAAIQYTLSTACEFKTNAVYCT